MRFMKPVVLAALSFVALTGCNNGQPRIYRVAIDETPIRTIAVPSCFRNNNLPAGQGNRTEQNYRSEKEWVIWAGLDQTEYLDLGNQQYKLGNAPLIDIKDLIEGTNKTFSALRSVQEPEGDSYTYARQTQIQVTWDDYSYSPKGTIALNAQYACIRNRIDCPGTGTTPSDLAPADAASCQSTINFVARAIDAQRITAYGNNPGQL